MSERLGMTMTEMLNTMSAVELNRRYALDVLRQKEAEIEARRRR